MLLVVYPYYSCSVEKKRVRRNWDSFEEQITDVFRSLCARPNQLKDINYVKLPLRKSQTICEGDIFERQCDLSETICEVISVTPFFPVQQDA